MVPADVFLDDTVNVMIISGPNRGGKTVALKTAGLMSIPGGGAEILEDSVRKEVLAFGKCSADEWLDVMRQAHRNGLRTSSTMMYGMGEPIATRVFSDVCSDGGRLTVRGRRRPSRSPGPIQDTHGLPRSRAA